MERCEYSFQFQTSVWIELTVPYRFLNSDTLAALQIIHSEVHPQAQNQGPTNTNSGSKEGLSVYGLFQNLARTPQGKALLRQYFLRPSLKMSVINERLNTASVFLRPENDHALKSIAKSLGQIKNMKTVMIHLRKGVSNGQGKGGGIRCGVWSSLRSVREGLYQDLMHLANSFNSLHFIHCKCAMFLTK